MAVGDADTGVVGREAELAAAAAWLSGLSEGPASLVVLGEAGIGKTTVWRIAARMAHEAGATVLRSRPAQAELQLGFSVLADLLDPVADDVLSRLPAPLAAAVESAMLRGPPVHSPEPHAVGRGVVEILRFAAQEGAVVLAVDDLQWVDAPSARALAFAVRRIDGPVGVLGTLRATTVTDEPLGLGRALGARNRVLHLGPLSPEEIEELIRRDGSSEPRRVIHRIGSQAQGNPFYALELARSVRAPGFPASLGHVVADRLGSLSPAAHEVVELLAALGPTEVEVLAGVAAGAATGIDDGVRSRVLLVEDGRVRFSHPLLAAGAYAAIPPMRRRAAHRLGAELERGFEERARHLALATDVPDASAAETLEEAARRAQARGAVESGAAFAAEARRLTPPSQADDLARRRLLEADLLYIAGDDAAARMAVDDLLVSGVTGVLRARALIHRVQHDDTPAIAVQRLEEAVSEAAGDDVTRARALASLAWMRGMWAGHLDPAGEEAQAAVELAERTEDAGVLATALTTAGTIATYRGDDRSAAYFERAISVSDGAEWVAGDRSPFVAYAHRCFLRGDWDRAARLLAQERWHAERAGLESRLQHLDVFSADLAIRRGQWRVADRALVDALAWADSGYWHTEALLFRAQLAGLRGAPDAAERVDEARASMDGQEDPWNIARLEHALGVHDLAHGRAGDAAARLLPLAHAHGRARHREPGVLLVTPDAVEALVDDGDTDVAGSLTDDLQRRAEALDHPLCLAVAARCRGVVALGRGDVDIALEHLAVARARAARLDAPHDLARTRLIEGAALRRAGRRNDAAAALEAAAASFAELGADRWRERAEDELRRARPRRRGASELTAAERAVARLVVAGHTNREVAAQLYTAVATVEAHLTRIYRKLAVRSRTELARAVAEGRAVLEE